MVWISTTWSPKAISGAPGPLGSGIVTSWPSSAPVLTRTVASPQPLTSSSRLSEHGCSLMAMTSPLNCSADPDWPAPMTSPGGHSQISDASVATAIGAMIAKAIRRSCLLSGAT